MTDPNTIPDEVADAAAIAQHEFVLGGSEDLNERRLGITRQSYKVAIAAALDKMEEMK